MVLLNKIFQSLYDDIHSQSWALSGVKITLNECIGNLGIADPKNFMDAVKFSLKQLKRNEIELLAQIDADENTLWVDIYGMQNGWKNNFDFQFFTSKIHSWKAEVLYNTRGVRLLFKYFQSSIDKPIDVDTMIQETGLTRLEALELIQKFLIQGHQNEAIVENLDRLHTCEERYRAAHSLKGAARLMRASDLAFIAQKIELDIQNGEREPASLNSLRLELHKIEEWVNGETT